MQEKTHSMASIIPIYRHRLNLPEAQFTFIDHEYDYL